MLLVLWNGVAPGHEDEYEDWHEHEHVPERLAVPGFLWAQRWRRDGDGPPDWLTLYGVRDAAVLEGAPYRSLVARPTPASARMRALLWRMERWTCEPAAPAAGVDADRAWFATATAPAAGGAGHVLVARRTAAQPPGWLAPERRAPRPGDTLLAWTAPPAPAVTRDASAPGAWRRLSTRVARP